MIWCQPLVHVFGFHVKRACTQYMLIITYIVGTVPLLYTEEKVVLTGSLMNVLQMFLEFMDGVKVSQHITQKFILVSFLFIVF